MLGRIRLKNYRGFGDQWIPLRSFTVAVGQNNAGKSTVVEALRIISVVTQRYRNLQYKPPPDWLDLPQRCLGVSPRLNPAEIKFETIFHRYSEPPAEVEARFSKGESIHVYIGEDGATHAIIRDSEGDIIRSKSDAQGVKIPSLAALPQIGPVLSQESVRNEDYVRASISTPLASRHFRNQLHQYEEWYKDFKELAEDNWPGLQIRELSVERIGTNMVLMLQVRNEDFVGELGVMGHGLQMWLQTIWFLTRSREAHTVVLDEPDVYMHPDLQRRLVRYLTKRSRQLVLTTHSVEIMSEVQPESILIVDKRQRGSRFADSMESVQRALSGLGSSQNIHLARLWGARRFLLVEGKDIEILKRIHDLLYPERESLQALPNMEIGGWSGWPYAVGSSMAFRNAMGQEVTTYCVLDSDYHTPEQIAERYSDANERGVELHVWAHKEIENYLLVPSAIARLITSRSRVSGEVAKEDVERKLVELADAREHEVLDNLANEFVVQDRARGIQIANRRARESLQEARRMHGHIIPKVSGKALVSDIGRWCQETYGASFSVNALASELRNHEVAQDMRIVLRCIEEGIEFE